MGAAGNSGIAKPRHRRNRYNAAEGLIINPHLKWGLLTFTMFLAGKHYIVQEFGWDDDDRKDTKPEFYSAE